MADRRPSIRHAVYARCGYMACYERLVPVLLDGTAYLSCPSCGWIEDSETLRVILRRWRRREVGSES